MGPTSGADTVEGDLGNFQGRRGAEGVLCLCTLQGQAKPDRARELAQLELKSAVVRDAVPSAYV
jgi:hypothetical protein